MKSEKRKIGDKGEDIACKFLENKGFLIIERNYLKKWGELDIIAKKDGTTHFVEVKTVSRESLEGHSPEENVHKAKMKRIARAIQTYFIDRGGEAEFVFDIIAVTLDQTKRQAKVKFLENIILDVY